MSLFTETDVEKVSEKILLSVRDKITEQLSDAFYGEMKNFLYEHYRNTKDVIEKELISDLADQYIKSPTEYKYKELRNKMWEENKDEMVEILTDEAILSCMEKILLRYTHRDYHFNWQWKDGVVEIVLKNWDKFKDDERIKSAFGRELENKQNYINTLERKLEELKEAI